MKKSHTRPKHPHHHKRRIPLYRRLVPPAILFALVMAILFWPAPRVSAPATGEASTMVESSPAPTVAPTSEDPLLISAIRSRTYTASPIVRTQTLGDQTGYTNSLVSYQSDGLKVNALMSVPHGTMPAGGWPVIIFNHGYINPAAYQTNGPEYSQFIATLARAGYVVIKPDYRGHGQSQGVPTGGHFSPVYAYDVLNLIASVKQDSLFDRNRIGLVGHSMGGHAVARAIVVSADVRASAILSGVVGSFSDIFYNWPNSPMPGDLPAVVQTTKREYIERYGDPRTNPTFWDGASALNYVKDVRGPVLVQHSTADSTVPMVFADHFVSALRTADKSVDYRTYSGDDHQLSSQRTLVLQTLTSFFKANL